MCRDRYPVREYVIHRVLTTDCRLLQSLCLEVLIVIILLVFLAVITRFFYPSPDRSVGRRHLPRPRYGVDPRLPSLVQALSDAMHHNRTNDKVSFSFGRSSSSSSSSSRSVAIPPPPANSGLSKQGYSTLNAINHTAIATTWGGVPKKRAKTEEE